MSLASFADVNAVTPVSATEFTAVISPDWTIGGKPNGGYLLAMLGRAVTAAGAHRDVLAASAHFLRAPDPGPCVIAVEELRAGRSASQLRARLSQDDRICVEALFTTGELDPDAQPYWTDGVPAPGVMPFEDCHRVPPQTPFGVPALMMGQVDMRVEPATSDFMRAQPTGRGVLRGWLALPDGEPFDVYSLLWAIDSFPPGTFDIELTGWVPTLELSAYVRARPAPGPVRVLQRVHLIDGQRFDEACFIWDSTGRLVAQSTQLAAIRLG